MGFRVEMSRCAHIFFGPVKLRCLRHGFDHKMSRAKGSVTGFWSFRLLGFRALGFGGFVLNDCNYSAYTRFRCLGLGPAAAIMDYVCAVAAPILSVGRVEFGFGRMGSNRVLSFRGL